MTPPPPSPTSERTAGVAEFFDQFDIAFGTFDGAEIAKRYAEPYVACRSDGTAATFDSSEETARYFQGLLDEYYAMGVRSCRHRDVDAVQVGENHRLATATWELCDDAENIVTTWRESYVLVGAAAPLHVRSSIDH